MRLSGDCSWSRITTTCISSLPTTCYRNGMARQSAEFAKQEADQAGGDAGDQIYYHIATELVALGDDEFAPQELDWQRIQRGYASISTHYGPSERLKNDLAYMAWKYQDVSVAASQFAL